MDFLPFATASPATTGADFVKWLFNFVSGCFMKIAPVRKVELLAQKKKKQPSRPTGNLLRRWFFYLLLAIVLVPASLLVAYTPSAVHPVSTVMLRDAVLLRGYQRQWVALDDIAPALVQSVLMSEDGQYCFHGGVDWKQLNIVLDGALDGEKTRGASTIAMQTAKNLFLWSSRSYLRKALEVPLAMSADAIWSKRRMMEIYLNVAEWGPGIFGIEAAAQHYYGIPASQLSRRRAAYLAVTLPNPHVRNPLKPSRGMTRLASIVERRAHQSGAYIKCLDA
tara:strand:- start:112331 stop:113167 length:837 start_codon:yes stop_codon:yes gene_type:complete